MKNIDWSSIENPIKELMQSATANTAEAFSKLIGEQVEVEATLLSPWGHKHALNYLEEDNTYGPLLLTEIIGAFSGSSFLLIPQQDVGTFSERSAQALKMPLQNASEELKEGMLLEMDNILSAAFITALANETDAQIYGGVPSIMSSEAHHFHSRIEALEADNDILCSYEFRLRAPESGMSLLFIWVLEVAFANQIPIH